MEPPKTLTSRKTQTQVLQDILSLYNAGSALTPAIVAFNQVQDGDVL